MLVPLTIDGLVSFDMATDGAASHSWIENTLNTLIGIKPPLQILHTHKRTLVLMFRNE